MKEVRAAVPAVTSPLMRPRRPTRDRLCVLRYLGSLFQVTGLLLLLPLSIMYILGEEHWISPLAFALPALIGLLVGTVLCLKAPAGVPSVRDAMVITALGWIGVSFLASLPFHFGLSRSYIDAFFEAVSGLTTTGITLLEGLDGMPRSILLWRSLIQWLGGLGILTFFLAVSFRGGSAAVSLFSAEGHKIGTARPVPSIHRTVKILWGIYLALTAGAFITFWLAGMSLFDAVCHCLTSVSTGGFSTHDRSIGYYSFHRYPYANVIEYGAIVFMLAGGINFLIHFRVLSGNPSALWRDFEMKRFWGIVAVATVLITADHFINSAESLAQTLAQAPRVVRASLFQVASLVTSTGYGTVDINDPFFPALSKQIFIFLMVVGGCVGSTAGGIKVLRLGILVKMLRNQVGRLIRPSRCVQPVLIGGEILPGAEVQRVAGLVFGWLLLICLGGAVTAVFSDLGPWESLSGMTSAVGNMGPFYFSVHKMAGLSWVIKVTYIVGMLAGRLEILPLAVLFSRSTWK